MIFLAPTARVTCNATLNSRTSKVTIRVSHKAETGNAPHTDQWTGEIASRAAYRIDRQDCAPSRCSTEPTNQEWLAIGMHAGIGTPVSEATGLDELDAFLACCAHYQFT